MPLTKCLNSKCIEIIDADQNNLFLESDQIMASIIMLSESSF